MKNNILVTGGCGFIGSNLVDYLCNHTNCSVKVIDNNSVNYKYQNSKAKYYKYDINDERTEGLYENIDCVFHVAAKARIQECILNPKETFYTNYFGTLSVLEYCRINEVKKIIFSSTSAIYGNNKAPQFENDEPNCLNGYSLSKLHAEKLCKHYADTYDMNITILRYFNVYGPRESYVGPYASVVGIFNRQKSNNQPLTIVGDGLQRRDFISVFDVIGANIAAFKNVNPLKAEVINVGYGKNYSVLELAKMFNTEYIFLPERAGESKETLCRNNKLKTVLNYVPSITLESYIDSLLN